MTMSNRPSESPHDAAHDAQHGGPQAVVPAGGDILRAGVSGAAIAGTWTAIYEAMRVRNNEITTEEAVRTTAASAAIGAGAGAVAHVASQAARSVPILGLAALAAVVLYLMSPARKPASAEPDRAGA